MCYSGSALSVCLFVRFSVIDKRNELIVKEILECSQQRLEEQQADSWTDSSDVDAGGNANGYLYGSRGNVALSQRPHSLAPAAASSSAASMSKSLAEDLQLGRFYSACMDAASINARGIEPIKPILKRIDDIDSWEGVMFESGGQMHTAQQIQCSGSQRRWLVESSAAIGVIALLTLQCFCAPLALMQPWLAIISLRISSTSALGWCLSPARGRR